MKKVISILAVLICVSLLTMPFSAADVDAYTLYERANTRLENARSYEMRMNMDVEMEYDGATAKVSGFTTMRTLQNPDGSIEMEMHMSYDELDMRSSMYYRNGYIYQEVGDQKIRYRMDIDDLVAMLDQYGSNLDVSKETFEEANVEVLDSGNYRIQTVLKREDFGEAMESVVDAMLEMMGIEDVTVTFGNIGYGVVISPDGDMQSYGMSFAARMAMDDEIIIARYNVTCAIASVNTFNAIDYPNLDNYTTVNFSDLLAA